MSVKTYWLECAWYCALALGAAPAGAAGSTPADGAVSAARLRPAVTAQHAAQAVMLGAAWTGTRIVSVGERGLILFSDDQGQHWQQASVPVSVTLTAVRFADPQHGIAVGHAGVILTSADGGAHWQTVMDGQRIAALALADARARNDAAAMRDAERLTADGADKPLLDICLLGNGRMLAVGAYGLAFGSDDGGRNWRSWMGRIDNPQGLHLNTVRRAGDTILIAGERGMALLSSDSGRSFRRLQLPYRGSFFTAELPAANDQQLLLAGLRGNVWRSADGGNSWQQLNNPLPVSITGSTLRHDGSLLLANQSGLLLTLQGQTLTPVPAQPLPPLNGVLELPGRQLLALSMQGLLPVTARTSGAQP